MQANRGRDTRPEILLRKTLHSLGFRYRKNFRVGPGSGCEADIVFRGPRVCIFVDGCFWHGCPDHFLVPKANTEWWREKIEANRKRDQRQTADLTEGGWTVLRVWEHEITAENLPMLGARIADLLSSEWGTGRIP